MDPLVALTALCTPRIAGGEGLATPPKNLTLALGLAEPVSRNEEIKIWSPYCKVMTFFSCRVVTSPTFGHHLATESGVICNNLR